MKISNFTLIFFIILILIIFLIFVCRKVIIDNFDNLENNIFTYDTCCTEKEIAHCETYGKTGVCNYLKNNKSCLCQNAY